MTAIAPFVKLFRKIGGIKISFLEFLGQQWGAVYLDIIAKELSSDEKDCIFQWLYKNTQYSVLFLKYIPQHTTFFKKGELYTYSACPQVNLHEYFSFEDYKNKFYSKNLKQNLRTAANRIEKNKDILKKTIEEINKNTLIDIVKISKSKLNDNKGWVYGDKNKLDFFTRIYQTMPSNVSFLKINGENSAYRTNIIFNHHKFCLDASYDRNYNKYELGAFSVELNLNDSFERKLHTECMGPGIDIYKFKFTKDLTCLYFFLKKGNRLFSRLLIVFLNILVKRKGKEFIKELSAIK